MDGGALCFSVGNESVEPRFTGRRDETVSSVLLTEAAEEGSGQSWGDGIRRINEVCGHADLAILWTVSTRSTVSSCLRLTLRNAPAMIWSAACSILASSNTSAKFFPPSSRSTGLSAYAALEAMIRPTCVDPVKLHLRTLG